MERDLTERVSAKIINSNAVKKISFAVDKLLHRCFDTAVLRPLKIFLNGTWTGHPLHPALTDIPIGAWTLTIVLDLIGLLFKLPQLGLASSIAACIGVVGAAGAIAAGLMDWMDVDPPEKAIGAVHAMVNTGATVIFLASFLWRWAHHWQLSGEAFAFALGGYLLVMSGGYLGGVMVYHMGVMINRNAYRSGPDNFKSAAAAHELGEGQLKRVDIEGQPVLLVRLDGIIHALGAVCSHYGAPLDEGKLEGSTVQCPWHLSRFALEDGSVVEGPACAAVPAYDCRIVNNQVEVKMRR